MIYLVSLMTYFFVLFFQNKIFKQFIFFWIAIGFLFYLPISIDYFKKDSLVVNDALFFSAIFNLCYIFFIVCFSRFKYQFHIEYNDCNYQKLYNIIYAAFLISTIIPIFMVYYKFGAIFGLGWRDVKDIPFYFLFLFLYNFSSISIYTSYYNKEKKIALILFLLSMLMVVVFQSRSLMLPVIFPFIYKMLVSTRNKDKLSLVITSFLFLFLFFLLQQYRYSAGVDFSFSNSIDNAIDMIREGNGELSIIDSFYSILERPNEIKGFGEAGTYLRVLFFYLPTGFLDLKSQDLSHEIWNAITGLNGVGGSLHPTHYGMAFVNFGWLGSIFGPLFLVLFMNLTRIVFNSLKSIDVDFIYLSAFISGCILIARGSVYNGSVILIVGAFLTFLIINISKVKMRFTC